MLYRCYHMFDGAWAVRKAQWHLDTKRKYFWDPIGLDLQIVVSLHMGLNVDPLEEQSVL